MKKIGIIVSILLLVASMSSASFAKVLVKGDSVVKMNEDINMGEDLKFDDLVAIKGSVNVKGAVNGDVVSILGNIHLYPTAKIKGDIVIVGGTLTRDEGSTIGGKVTEIGLNKEGLGMMSGIPAAGAVCTGNGLLMNILIFLGFIGLSMVLVSFMTKQLGAISSNIEKKWAKSLLWGVLASLLIVPVAFVLAITIVGIPLIMIELVAISVAMTLGYVAVAQLLGKKFTKAARKPNQPMIVEIVWGLFILFLLDFVPIIGPIIKIIAAVIGFGSAVMTKIGF